MISVGLILASAWSLPVAHSTTASRVIALAPVGDTPAADVGAPGPILRATFGAEIVVAPAILLPQDSYDASRRQYRSTAILNVLSRVKHPEWERLLGVANVDLCVPELNFVFGEADSRRGVAVFSLARLRTSDAALFARRAATEAIHELGHTWGLSHCPDPQCVIWFSNTLSESDRKGARFCPRHEAELARARSR